METVDVIAKTIDNKHIVYKCDICSYRYKKNGEMSARSKIVNHYHGSCGDLTNRIEYRTSHCVIYPHNVRIHITDETIKMLY